MDVGEERGKRDGVDGGVFPEIVVTVTVDRGNGGLGEQAARMMRKNRPNVRCILLLYCHNLAVKSLILSEAGM